MEEQSAVRVSHLAVSDNCEKMMKGKGSFLHSTLPALVCALLGEFPLTPPPYKELGPGAGMIERDDSYPHNLMKPHEL